MFNWESAALTDGFRSFRNSSWLGHRLCPGHRLPIYDTCSISLSDTNSSVKPGILCWPLSESAWRCSDVKCGRRRFTVSLSPWEHSISESHFSYAYVWERGCFTSYLLQSSQGKPGQNTPVWTPMKGRAATSCHFWLTAPVLLISSPLVLDRGYCHCSTSDPLALNTVLWMSLPQLLTLWEMVKHSISKGTCALISCCIPYLNDDSGILQEEIKGEKKIYQNSNSPVEVDKH